MVKHVILWQLKEELSDAEKAAVKAGIKAGLEGLAGQIPGLVEIHVNINALPSSNADLMLDTTFESAEALKGYSTHPAHVAVANSKVRPYYKNRVCLDYEVYGTSSKSSQLLRWLFCLVQTVFYLLPQF